MNTLRLRTTMRLGTSAAFLLAASPLLAQGVDPPSSDAATEELSLADLLTIELQTGSFLELDLARSALSMTLITRDQVRISGARHLSELLEVYVPGFQVMVNKWNGTLWGMRGVANDRNTKFIVLVNGHKMNTEARDGFFQETDLGILGDIERVEVLRGPAGLVYGSGAIAGIVNIVTRQADRDGVEVSASMGAWNNFEQKSRSIQAQAFGSPAPGHRLATSMGWRQSDGLGVSGSRIWGQGHWPYPFWLDNADARAVRAAGVPTDGSAQATPGNWKASVDWSFGGWRLYARGTHQVQQAGGMFIRDPWPAVQGSPAGAAQTLENLDSLLEVLSADTTADSTLVAALLATRSRLTAPGSVRIDGRMVSPENEFWSQTEGWNTQRREYVADNFMANLSYEHAIGGNTLKLNLGFDANTNRIQREMRPGYESFAEGEERRSFVEETFGERRYTMGAMMLFKNLPNTQLATGTQWRIDDIGNDISGRNSRAEAVHRVVSDIIYQNIALFSEGYTDLTSPIEGGTLGLHYGMRWDGHTRTIDKGGTWNGKFGIVMSPARDHVIKLIAQSSSNNGSADNYEYNRNNFSENNTVRTAPSFERPHEIPGLDTPILPGVSEEELHKLKPERVYSFELTGTSRIDAFTIMPSVSYNMVRDLFAWNQTLFRVVNAGEYNHLAFDLEVRADLPAQGLVIGLAHGTQLPVNTDPNEQTVQFETGLFDRTQPGWYDSILVDGRWNYFPVATGIDTVDVNPVREQITRDGNNFLSLATHTTKLFADWKPATWATFHTSMRVFWGLAGRDSIYDVAYAAGWNTWNIASNIMNKWNASAHFDLSADTRMSLFVYDILGVDNGNATGNDLAIHSLRWQQMGTSDQKDLYSLDQRSFAIRIDRFF